MTKTAHTMVTLFVALALITLVVAFGFAAAEAVGTIRAAH